MNQKYCKILAHVVAGYFVVGVICSCLVVTIHIWTDSEAKYLLKSKNIKIWTLAIFTAVSSFVNCGFTPVNDNMSIFRKNPGFLLPVYPTDSSRQHIVHTTLEAKHMGLGEGQQKRGIYLHSSVPRGDWLHVYATTEECY
jgi:hypothetical protein